MLRPLRAWWRGRFYDPRPFIEKCRRLRTDGPTPCFCCECECYGDLYEPQLKDGNADESALPC